MMFDFYMSSFTCSPIYLVKRTLSETSQQSKHDSEVTLSLKTPHPPLETQGGLKTVPYSIYN